MAIPSGSGTEVLKVYRKDGLSSEQTFIDGAANHIYTVLSIILTEVGNVNETVDVYIESGSSVITYLLKAQPIGAYQTFAFNDKFVMSGDMDLKGLVTGGGNVDVVCSYIDQDWT